MFFQMLPNFLKSRGHAVIMTTLLFGTGVGTFLLLAVWTTAFLLCFISLRTQRNIGPIAVLVATLVMLILLAIPRGSEKPVENKFYDNFFIWRILLIIFLGVSCVGGFAAYLFTHLMEPKNPQLIKGWKL